MPEPWEPDPDDPDTEPLNTSVWEVDSVLSQGDPVGERGWVPAASGARLEVPNGSSRARWVMPAIGVGALVVVAVVVVLVAQLVGWGGSSGSGDGGGSVAASAASDPARDELMALLPRGYGPGVCRVGGNPGGAQAAVVCGPNVDAAGTTARFAVFADGQGLRGALDAAIAGMRVVVCPGNYQSPGPWRRGSAPDVVVGTLVCGRGGESGQPVLVWSVDADRLLAVIESDPRGPTLGQLYSWWSSHS